MSTKSPHATDKHVGSRVRMRRLMLKMSQEALADRVGLTFQQVQKYEKGTNRVSASRLQEFAAILQVPVSFFFEEVPQTAARGEKLTAPPTAYITEFLSTSDGLALIGAFVRISSKGLRRSIVRLVEEIAAENE